MADSPCHSCAALIGADCAIKPHDWLKVFQFGPSVDVKNQQTEFYRCLVCKGILVREFADSDTRRIWASYGLEST